MSNKYWMGAQTKAQGLEAVYPEGWVLDAKAVLDLGKYGIRLVAGTRTGATGSLDALGQLEKTDVSSIAKIENGFYRDGPHPSDWTPGKFADIDINAANHWSRHSKEFPELHSLNDYTSAANNFVKNPPPSASIFYRANGDKLIYDPVSNTFAIQAPSGMPRTMFKPDSANDYWTKQTGMIIK